jgi:hypothetical protein
MHPLHQKFRSLFWDGFHRPKLKTARIQEVWEHLEKLNDILSGPLFAVYEKGDFLYVLEDQKRFPKIQSLDDFKKWAIYFTDCYSDEINSVETLNEEEAYDIQVLRFQNDTRKSLIDQAIQLTALRLN